MEETEIWVNGKAGLKQGFSTLLTNVNRPGAKDVLNWLELTDFFTAPASVNGHNNYPGGLVEHSLNVLFRLRELCAGTGIPDESIVIASILHDVCKADFYVSAWKQKKEIDPITGKDILGLNGKAIWNPTQYFTINDKFPCGHGEKSVILIQQYMSLTPHEIMAIRWHMGGFDDAARQYGGGQSLTAALQKFPLVTYLHCADLLSCLPENPAYPQGNK